VDENEAERLVTVAFVKKRGLIGRVFTSRTFSVGAE
jgi:hypothetical protein